MMTDSLLVVQDVFKCVSYDAHSSTHIYLPKMNYKGQVGMFSK